MENFEPTHVDRLSELKKIQVLDHVVVMIKPNEGLNGILYADSEWNQYVMVLDDFGNEYKPIGDPFELDWIWPSKAP